MVLPLPAVVDQNDFVTKGQGALLELIVQALQSVISTNTDQGIRSDLLMPLKKVMEQTVAGNVADDEKTCPLWNEKHCNQRNYNQVKSESHTHDTPLLFRL
jgi:hypothetical protein